MPDIASVLKSEIARLARKELRSETERLKKSSALCRSEIAALKRRIDALEKQVARAPKNGTKSPADEEPESKFRFSAKGLHSMRQRLGLSAADLGRLLGVSPQTVYNWESAATRPRAGQLGAIAAVRGMGRKEVAARLAAGEVQGG